MPYLDSEQSVIDYVDSFPADTTLVSNIIDKLIAHLKRAGYPKDEYEEIVIAMDEAITNAIQETICQDFMKTCSATESQRSITIRYRITSDEFDATVIDHGKGLDIKKMIAQTPSTDSDEYQKQIFDYIDSQKNKKLQVRLNGQEVLLNGIGAGLKIILTFMDIVKIDLMDKEHVINSTITDFTDGTILNVRRKRRYA